MTKKPYTLIVDGKLQGFYETMHSALYAADQKSPRPAFKIYREDARGQQLMHEEGGA